MMTKELINWIASVAEKGHVKESGTIEFYGRLWSYNLKQLKQKPKKTKEANGQ